MAALFASLTASAEDGGLFLQDQVLADGRVVVVAEAPLEPRSVGSYSIRLYSGANPRYPFDNFVTGIVVDRDGSVGRVTLDDTDGDGNAELIVITRSAGSGSWLSARAFALENDNIHLVARLDNPEPGQDPSQLLRR